jgi:hypothetical protein
MAEFDSIVGGLFGASPQTLNLAREQQALDFANRVATAEGQRPGLGSVLGANVMGARGIRELGGVFGVEDPLMQRVSQQQQLLSGVDFTDLNSLTKAAQQATASGRPDIADALAKRALEIRTKVEERQLNRDTQLQIAAERNQARLEEAKQRGADQKEIARIRAEGQQAILDLRTEALQEKKQEKIEKQEQAANMAIGAADRVINEVKDAKKLVSGFTAGAGSYLSAIPLTDAKDLSKRLNTIKANLGFDRLQQMRDASPTGGALGQVAVQELIALQSTIASLDQDQSPTQLKEALDKIEFHYSNWRDTVRKSGKATPTGTAPEAGKQGTAANPPNDPLGIRKQ